ncbi:KfrB domain-containing protein [Brucella intermedia]|uniref:KfrB domain-containing protein n=1 Tax=Brucella intermedia TaxID=94625 RepID=UPI003208263D
MRDIQKEGYLGAPNRALKAEGHQLLVVINESRTVDTMQNGEWVSRYLGSRNSLPKGVYDLSGAAKPDRTASFKSYDGNVMHIDKKGVYQLHTNEKGKNELIKHDPALFKDKLPKLGDLLKVEYTRGQGHVSTKERGLER